MPQRLHWCTLHISNMPSSSSSFFVGNEKGKKCFMAISQLLISFHLIFNFLQTCSLLFIHKKNLPSAFTRHIQNNGCCFFSLFLSFPLVMKLMSLSVVEGESRLSAEEMLTTMNYISSVLLQALNSQDSRGRCKIDPPWGRGGEIIFILNRSTQISKCWIFF